ncbi:uncharacterized protein IL334_001144 [Kwoniella shivajii]|uniref:Bromo domain-containing protein n=1 Tax=Kwoniella shivajii TaxID=564305 RepID=A0ABZ1CRG8_9TREE|nr:hypothetical protein IL334_001144 [Kwoniella shivajii]
MVTPSTPKIPPIKIKLSLGSKLVAPTVPPTPTSNPLIASSSSSSSTPILTLTTSKKGKAKAIIENVDNTEQDETIHTPNTVDERGKKKKSKSKVASPYPPSNEKSHANSTHSHNENGDEHVNEENQAGPSKIEISNPAPSSIHPVQIPAEQHDIQSYDQPVTPKPSHKAKSSKPSTSKKSSSTPRSSKATSKSSKAARSKPSAIPSRLLSEALTSVPPSSSKISTYAPTSVIPVSEDPETPIKLEYSEATSPDPLSLPVSPSAYHGDSLTHTPQNENYDDTPQSGRGRTGGRWMRIKRPLKELLNKLLIEMRRKDDYALFEEPVDLEAFPDYLNVIGGEDKMMDMGTMQNKVNNGEYTTLDQVEHDLRSLVDAAQKFNPPGSIPFNSAARILTIGMKHIERARPIVLTPTPSPTRGSATPFGRGMSVFSGREGTIALEESRRIEDLPPGSYIPEQMLDFPPNSLQALAVGWNMNGGKRVHAKKIVRSREKFPGKWRHWELDGTRDIAEMEDPANLFDQSRTKSSEEMMNTLIDWRGLRKYRNPEISSHWWESDTSLSGPTIVAGQPPIPQSAYNPRKEKIIERHITSMEFGLYPEIEAEIKFLKKRAGLMSEEEILSEHLRPIRSRPNAQTIPNLKSNTNAVLPPNNLINIYDSHPSEKSAGDWLREMTTGDIIGEAYLTSISKFIKGAMETASNTSSSTARNSLDTKIDKADYPLIEEDRIPLDEYVMQNYQDGLLSAGSRKAVLQTIEEISKYPADRPHWVNNFTNQAYGRIALREMTSSSNPMDIKPLLRMEGDFLHQGVGGKSGVKEGLDWIGSEIKQLNDKLKEKIQLEAQKVEKGKRKREDNTDMDMDIDDEKKREDSKRIKIESNGNVPSGGSSPLSDAPESKSNVTSPKQTPLPTSMSTPMIDSTMMDIDEVDPGNTNELRQLRLELVALSKFYPLPALKKMRAFEAAKLLPVNVRGLMTVPEDLPKVGSQSTGDHKSK